MFEKKKIMREGVICRIKRQKRTWGLFKREKSAEFIEREKEERGEEGASEACLVFAREKER